MASSQPYEPPRPAETTIGVSLAETVTLEQLEKQQEGRTVFYAVHTCWWTDDPDDLWGLVPLAVVKETRIVGSCGVIGGGTPHAMAILPPLARVRLRDWIGLTERKLQPPMPCDPRGSVLMQTAEGDAASFIRSAQEHPAHYGRHGLAAFMAAHAKNCQRLGLSWSFKIWESYNALLDRQQGE